MMITVNPNNSSCARKIDEIFQHHRLKLIRFAIMYRDSNENSYLYHSDESSTTSIDKTDEQPVLSVLSTSFSPSQDFDTFASRSSQNSVDGQAVISDIHSALAQDHVTLVSLNVTSEECSITYPPGGTYAPPIGWVPT